jgi:hypothetical protein
MDTVKISFEGILQPNEGNDVDHCKGLIYRCRDEVFVSPTNGAYVHTTKMTPLKTKTCPGCERCWGLHEALDEEIANMNMSYGDRESMLPNDPVHGGLYAFDAIDYSRDWESGLVDDVTYGFVLLIEEEK